MVQTSCRPQVLPLPLRFPLVVAVTLDPAAAVARQRPPPRGRVARLIAREELLTRRRSDRDLVALALPACGCLDGRGGDRRGLRADVGARSTAVPTASRLRC